MVKHPWVPSPAPAPQKRIFVEVYFIICKVKFAGFKCSIWWILLAVCSYISPSTFTRKDVSISPECSLVLHPCLQFLPSASGKKWSTLFGSSACFRISYKSESIDALAWISPCHGGILCILGHLATALVSTHWIPGAFSSPFPEVAIQCVSKHC